MKKKEVLIGIVILLLCIYFISYPMTIFWDSGHYATYIPILKGMSSWANWDIVRGIVFPGMIYISQIIFGETTMGITILSFMFYLVMLLSVYLMINELFKDKNEKFKKIVNILTMVFLIIDPLLFGYFHALLTEFVAISISCLMCYLSWKWIDIDYYKKKKEYIIYTIVFVIGTVVSWHLKQPYVSITFFPVLIATVLSIINNKNKKNVIQRFTTMLMCIIALVCSIKIWNTFLEKKGVDINGDRNVVAGFGEQLVNGIINYKIEKNIENREIKYLSEKEIKKYENKPEQYNIINIYNLNNKLIDQELLYKGNSNISTTNGLLFVVKQLVKHPVLVLDSYLTTYLAIADIYPKVTKDGGVSYEAEKKLNIKYCHENCTIGFSYLNRNSNIFYMPDHYYQNVANYEQVKNTSVILSPILGGLRYFDIITYKIIIAILPFVLIGALVLYFKNKKYKKEMSLAIILLAYSFMHIMVHVVVSANIDRYAAPTYVTILLGYFIYIYCITNLVKRNAVKKNEKKFKR